MGRPASPATYRAKWNPPRLPAAFAKARVNTSQLFTKSILSFPEADLAGDVVIPAGIDWSKHQACPEIDLEHRRTPEVKGMPVAWARASLSEPGAPYALEWANLNFGGDGEADRWEKVPIGTDYFDKSCRVSMQVFALREQDVLPASSLEFEMLPAHAKAIGWSELEGRQAYRFEKCRVHRWTICAKGVCPHALTLTKSATQVPEPLQKILTDRRVNVGGRWEPLHGMIAKALGLPNTKKSSTVRVEKAMDDYEDGGELESANEAALADAPADDADMGEDAPALGGVSAKYKFADAILAAVDEYEADMQSSDSPELRKLAEKFKEMASTLAEKVKSAGDKHDAKLNGDGNAVDDSGEEGDAAEPEDESADMEKDDEGTFKAVRRCYKPILKACRVKRFKAAEVAAAIETSREPEAPTVTDLIEQYRSHPAVAREIKRAKILN